MIRRKGYPHVSKSFTKKSTASTWAKQTELDMAIRMRKHDNKQKITIARLAKLLSVSSRTVHRHMCVELKKEKELLNQQL